MLAIAIVFSIGMGCIYWLAVPIARAFISVRKNFKPSVQINWFHYDESDEPYDESQVVLCLRLSAIICAIAMWCLWGIDEKINREKLATEAEYNQMAEPSEAKPMPSKP